MHAWLVSIRECALCVNTDWQVQEGKYRLSNCAISGAVSASCLLKKMGPIIGITVTAVNFFAKWEIPLEPVYMYSVVFKKTLRRYVNFMYISCIFIYRYGLNRTRNSFLFMFVTKMFDF